MASRILGRDELSRVAPIAWLETGPQTPTRANPPGHGPSRAAANAAASQAGAEADRERERIERDAHQRGFSEGKTVGRDQAAAELQPLMERMGRSLSDL